MAFLAQTNRPVKSNRWRVYNGTPSKKQKKLDVLCTSAVSVHADIKVYNFSGANKGNLRIDQGGHGEDEISLKVAAPDKITAVLRTAALNRPNVQVSFFVWSSREPDN